MSGTQQMASRDDRFGMLVWTMPVKLVDVSRSGCRVEIDRHLAIGTNGQLQLEMDGLVHLDDVRVCRSQQREGASRIYQLGVELLRTRRLSRRSLRLALRRIIGEQPQPSPAFSDEVVVPAAVDGREERQKRGPSRSPPLRVPVES